MVTTAAAGRLPARPVQAILATTDVHSALDNAEPLLSHLHHARPTTLIVDCGDFFEGSGYYLLGGGALERQTLMRLYDVLAPGNHGWRHHLAPDLRALTVCANINQAGLPVFHPFRAVDIDGQCVAVTAVLGEQAFACLPADCRSDLTFIPPDQALHTLANRHRADSWVVLSHAGYEHDLKLAAACPHLDVIFSGHCHSDQYGPTTVGTTVVVKGRELAEGYAVAAPDGAGWRASVHTFAPSSGVPETLQDIANGIDRIRGRLRAPLGVLAPRYRHRQLDRSCLLREVADYLLRSGTEAVLLNETSLRTIYLREYLTVGTLLGIEPFDNQLVTTPLPGTFAGRPHDLLTDLTRWMGPIITAPDPLPGHLRQVVTTRYVASSFFDTPVLTHGQPFADVIRHVLRTNRP